MVNRPFLGARQTGINPHERINGGEA